MATHDILSYFYITLKRNIRFFFYADYRHKEKFWHRYTIIIEVTRPRDHIRIEKKYLRCVCNRKITKRVEYHCLAYVKSHINLVQRYSFGIYAHQKMIRDDTRISRVSYICVLDCNRFMRKPIKIIPRTTQFFNIGCISCPTGITVRLFYLARTWTSLKLRMTRKIIILWLNDL